jgi:hypothetical protein
MPHIAAIDLFVVPTNGFRLLYALVIDNRLYLAERSSVRSVPSNVSRSVGLSHGPVHAHPPARRYQVSSSLDADSRDPFLHGSVRSMSS